MLVLENIGRTPKCDGNLKFDGHAKVRWSEQNPNGMTCQSLMVRVQSPKSDGVTHQSPVVLVRLIKHKCYSCYAYGLSVCVTIN